MEASARKSPPRPGVTLATCLLAAAVLATLGSEVIRQRRPAEAHALPEKTQPEQPLEPVAAADAPRRPVDRGSLEAWPIDGALEPPLYQEPLPAGPVDPVWSTALSETPITIIDPLEVDPLELEPEFALAPAVIALPDEADEPAAALPIIEPVADAEPERPVLAPRTPLFADPALTPPEPAPPEGEPSAPVAGYPTVPRRDAPIIETHTAQPPVHRSPIFGPPPGGSESEFGSMIDPGPIDSPFSFSAPPEYEAPLAEPEPANAEEDLAAVSESAAEDVVADETPLAVVTPEAVDAQPTLGDGDALDFNDIEAELARHTPIDELMQDTPTPGRVARILTTDVREAFSLGRHGALYAARARFIDVLKKVAQAKDAADGTDRHSTALAAGLRAVDEAASFVPRGAALDTDVDVRSIAMSHETPLYASDSTGAQRWALPHEAIARYHRYAQHKLGLAVSGDQAGSMALHGLGKTYARLEELKEAKLAGRTSLTMYRAAVEAHGGNYLAANELGVGLAQAGRYDAARRALERAIAGGGNSTVYRNLAVVQQNLGQPRLAEAARMQADQLAVAERAAGAFSRENGVRWVNPRDFSRVADAYSRQATPAGPRIAGRQAPPPIVAPTNPTAPPARSQTIVR